MTARSTSREREVETEAIKALVEEAKAAEREGRWTDASHRYELLVRNPFADDATRLSALRWLGRVYLELGNRGAAMDVLEAAVAAASQAGSPSAIAQALNVVAIVHQTGGDLDLAESRYTEARITAQSIGDAEALAMIDLVARQSPDWGQPAAHERALVTVATMVGTLLVARVVDEPALSNAFCSAALKHLTRD